MHGRHDRARIAPNRIGIEIEAALAFGTGHHGTTRGCLVALDALAKRTRLRRVLDVGTGSGVLAIAAAKISRRAVLASDIDPLAVRAARENTRRNGVATLVGLIQASSLAAHRFHQAGRFDLVLANILLSPLRRLATPLARLITADAHVVLSGLLPAHARAAIATYRARGFVIRQRILLDGWVTLVMRR